MGQQRFNNVRTAALIISMMSLIAILLPGAVSSAASPTKSGSPAAGLRPGTSDFKPPRKAPLKLIAAGPLVPETLDRDSRRDLAKNTQIPGQYIVVFEDSVTQPAAVAASQTQQLEGRVTFVYRLLGGYAAELSKSAVETLREDPAVRYVAPNHRVETFAQTTPTGILRSQATSNAIADIDGQDDTRVNADVAVIDSGIDEAHPDLNVYKRTNCVPVGEGFNNEEELLAKKCEEGMDPKLLPHGTHVAGIVGAIDNAQGVVGVAPGVRLWDVRVLARDGFGTTQWVTAAVEWVTAHAGDIEVANMSLGCPCAQPSVEQAIAQGVDAGIVFVVAAGNDRAWVEAISPAKNPDAITVSALADYDGAPGGSAEPKRIYFSPSDSCLENDPTNLHSWGWDDTMANFSNWGDSVDLAAPGTCIYSTLPTDGPTGAKDYGYASGTSMAAPHVAGAAAILASQSNPNSQKDTEAIRQQLIDDGSQNWTDIFTLGNLEAHFDEVQEPLLRMVPPSAHALHTTRPTDRTLTSVRLNGAVNPFGSETTYQFEYGLTSAYGSKTPASAKAVGAGKIDLALSQTLSELKPGTEYHYRLVATRGSEKLTTADRVVSTMSPSVTDEATGIDPHRARLEAQLYTFGANATYHFEWGESIDYGHETEAQSVTPAGESVEVEQRLTGLKAGRAYHYRVVATIGENTYFGEDEAFETTTSGLIAADYPATLEGAGTTWQYFWTRGKYPWGYYFPCGASKFTTTISGQTEALTMAPADVNCENSPLEPMEMNGCEYELHIGDPAAAGTLDIVPPGCGPIEVTPPAYMCDPILIPSQTGLFAEVWNWSANGVPTVEFAVETLDLKYSQTGGACTDGSFDDGLFAGGWKIQAKKGKTPVGLQFTEHFDVATTGGASSVEPRSATLNGTVTSRGKAAVYGFQYGVSSEYESETDIGLIEAGTSEPTAVEIPIQNLEPGTTYHYRLFVLNDEGGSTPWFGADETFTTLDRRPEVTATSADLVKNGAALLNGTINPKGFTTKYQFEYGTTTSYGSKVPVSAKSVGSGTTGVAVSERITGLSAETIYHYRLVATSSEGTRYGPDRTLEIHPPRVEADSYPATLSGSQVGGKAISFGFTPSLSTSCTGASVSGSLAAAAATTEFGLSYTGCTIFGLNGSISANGCSYVAHPQSAWTGHYGGPLDISCPAGKAIEFTTLTCTLTVGSQSGLQSIDLTNNPGAEPRPTVTAAFKASGIKYTVVKDGIGCPLSGTGNFEGATLKGSATVSATGGGSSPVAFYLTGEEEEAHTPRFEGESYPATLSGTEVSGKALSMAFTSNLNASCTGAGLSGSLSAAATSTEVTPSYSGCTLFGLNGSIAGGGCTYALQAGSKSGSDYSGPFAISCPAGKAIEFTTLTCTLTVGSQSGIGSASYQGTIASGKEAFQVGVNASGIKYTVVKDGIGCPLSGTGSFEGATLTSSAIVSAKDAGGTPIGARVGG